MTLDIEKTVKKLSDGFMMGFTDREACLYAGCSKQWLYDYCEKNPRYSDQKELMKENQKLKAKKILDKALDENDKQTAQWYLERKAKDEFSTKVEQYNSGTMDNKIEITFS